MLLDATLAATDLVFVAPVYWYSLPAAAKLYLDYWSAWLRFTSSVAETASLRQRAASPYSAPMAAPMS